MTSSQSLGRLALPVRRIHRDSTVFLGKSAQEAQSTQKSDQTIFSFENIASPWILPFLEEIGLASPEPLTPYLDAKLSLTEEDSLVFRIRGDIVFCPEMECVRCLERYRQEIRASCHGIFMCEKSFSQGKQQQHGVKGYTPPPSDDTEEYALSADDLEVYYYRNQTIYLDELILDTLQLSLPDFPLCKEDCPGILIEKDS